MTTSNVKSISFNSRDYFIIASTKDSVKLNGCKFHKSDHNRTKLLERQMTDSEVAEFKKISETFNKVIHSEIGRVYELSNKSFRKYYHK